MAKGIRVRAVTKRGSHLPTGKGWRLVRPSQTRVREQRSDCGAGVSGRVPSWCRARMERAHVQATR
jgi:hypothetical protein